MKYQSYNIKARVVYELKIKVKFDKVIKWFVLLLWSVRPCQKNFCWIRVARAFLWMPKQYKSGFMCNEFFQNN